MPSFVRSFDVDALQAWDAKNPGNAVRALFDLWCPPGEKAVGDRALRLGVWDGYLNFYIRGQSVAKLSSARNGPALSIHKAYATGRRKGDDALPVHGYQTHDAEALADPATGALIANWIEVAATYASAEKCFVDHLIAANPGVIDLKMGLPASDLPDSERVAPRMDLVVAQQVEGEPPSICFWEAKCANNGELRARGDTPPKVLGQVTRYVRWMEEGDRLAEVRQAYRALADILLRLHRVFRSGDGAECVSIWRALAGSEKLAIVVQPAIVIGNEWPQGYMANVASGRMRQCAASFARNGHRAKLRDAGLFVHEVGPDHDGPSLPALGPTVAPA